VLLGFIYIVMSFMICVYVVDIHSVEPVMELQWYKDKYLSSGAYGDISLYRKKVSCIKCCNILIIF